MTSEETVVYFSVAHFHGQPMYMAKTNQGLCYIGSPNAPFAELKTWIMKKFPQVHLVQSEDALQSEVLEITEFLQGKRDNFTVPIHPIGTDFQKEVWQALQSIPYGKTKTYTDIAAQIGRPQTIRAEGTAIGANPLLMIIPCHRVLAKDGGLAGFRAGVEMKSALLELESSNPEQIYKIKK